MKRGLSFRFTDAISTVGLGLWLFVFLAGCTSGMQNGRQSKLPKNPQERRFNLPVGSAVPVKLESGEAWVYRFEVQISSEGLYQFDTMGDSDTLCALVKVDPQKNKERFLVVSETGGEGDNCRMVWAFSKGRYVFKVRADGETGFKARIRQISWGKLNQKELQSSGRQVGVLQSRTHRDRYTFQIRSQRLVQFRVTGRGLMQCILRDASGRWLRMPGFRQPYGACTVAQSLKPGKYFFEVRSNEKKSLYKLYFQQLRLQTLRGNAVGEGFLFPGISDIFKVYLKEGHHHILQTHGKKRLRCSLEDELGHTLPLRSTLGADGRNCQIRGIFKEGWYYLRVSLRKKKTLPGTYLVNLRQQPYKMLKSGTDRKKVPAFDQSSILYRLKIDKARLFQIQVSGRPVRCSLRHSKGQRVDVMRLPQKDNCTLFANLPSGDYFLQLFLKTRDESPYRLQVSKYKPPTDNILSSKVPRLIGPVGSGYQKKFEFTLKKPQLISLETKGRLDTRCSLLNSGKRRIASDDDSGSYNNCLLTRYLQPGKYYLSIRVGGRKEGIFWVQRRSKKMPWLSPGKTYSGVLEKKTKPVTVMVKLDRGGMYSIGTRGKVDTICKLLNSRWKRIARNDDARRRDKNCMITRVLEPGVYPMQVYLYNNPGPFSLFVARVKTLNLQEGKKLTVKIDSTINQNFLQVRVQKRGLYELKTLGRLDTTCELLNSKGKRIARNDDAGRGNKNCRMLENLEKGLYFMKVRLFRSYRFRRYYRKLAFDVSLKRRKLKTKPLKVGKPLKGILIPGQISQYTIDVLRLGYYRIETTGSSDPKCYLFNARHQQVAYDDDSGYRRNCRISRRLPPGKYFLQIRPAFSRSRGPFKVFLTK